jgi:predicted SprT family Zn-dependent metalloprotease
MIPDLSQMEGDNMPYIISVDDLKKLRRDNPSNELAQRTRYEYKCSACGNHVVSDLHHSFALHCIKCGGEMPEVTPAQRES